VPWVTVPLAQVPAEASSVGGSDIDYNGSPGARYLALAPISEDGPTVRVNGALSTTGHVGDSLACSTGNWYGAPTSFAYQWKSAAANVGTNSNTYTPVAGDAGKSITCVVTATNATGGSTIGPVSNAVAIS
jgi:hypothetical protein